jgi:hypothetical protein
MKINTPKTANTCETNYFELDDVEFSDESYDPDDDGFNSDTDDEDEEEEFDGEYFTNSERSNRPVSDVPLYKLKSNNLLRKANSENRIPPAPPKPKRTFEHDIYVNSKNLGKNIPKHNKVETTNNNNNNTNMNNEHIYEALPSVKEFPEYFDTDEIKANKTKNNLNPNDLLMKKLSVPNSSHQRLSTLSSKITLSEPNLTQVGIKKSKNDVSLFSITIK